MLRETSASGDVNELLVSTLLVVTALSIFLASLGSAMAAYAQRADYERMDMRARDFCVAVRSSPVLISSSPGCIDAGKMDDGEGLLSAFHPNSLGFNYVVIIEDTSTYPERLDALVFETAPLCAGARHSASMPVLLETGGWERRTGMLTVMIWGLEC